MKLPRLLPLSIVAVAATLLSMPLARASVIQYTIEGVFYYSAVPTYIASGDHFTLTFDLDTLAGNNGSGQFDNAINNLSFNLDSGSTGKYAGGTMTSSHFLTLHDNVNGSFDEINFYARPNWPTGLNFASAGLPLIEFEFNLYSSNPNTFSLSGELGSLDSVLPALNLASYDNTADVNLVFFSWSNPQWALSNITSITSSSVPETSSTLVLMALSLAGLVGLRRRFVR